MDTSSQPEPSHTPLTNVEPSNTPTVAEPISDVPAQTFIQRHKALILSLLVAFLVLCGSGYYLYSTQYKEGGIAITVDGTPIYRNELDLNISRIRAAAQAQGIDPLDPEVAQIISAQAVDTLISNTLVNSAAVAQGITVTDEEVEKRYADLIEASGGQESFAEQIATIGITETELRENTRERILADKYFEAVSDIENIAPTDEELSAYIATVSTETLADIPAEEVEMIRAQIRSQKQQEIVLQLITDLREAAEVIIKE